jgi:hypothetical protein
MGNKFLEKQVQMMGVQRIVDWKIDNLIVDGSDCRKILRHFPYDIPIKNLMENKIEEYKL